MAQSFAAFQLHKKFEITGPTIISKIIQIGNLISLKDNSLFFGKGFFGRKVKYRVLQAIPRAIFWLLIMQRYRRVFGRIGTSHKQLKDRWMSESRLHSLERGFLFLGLM